MSTQTLQVQLAAGRCELHLRKHSAPATGFQAHAGMCSCWARVEIGEKASRDQTSPSQSNEWPGFLFHPLPTKLAKGETKGSKQALSVSSKGPTIDSPKSQWGRQNNKMIGPLVVNDTVKTPIKRTQKQLHEQKCLERFLGDPKGVSLQWAPKSEAHCSVTGTHFCQNTSGMKSWHAARNHAKPGEHIATLPCQCWNNTITSSLGHPRHQIICSPCFCPPASVARWRPYSNEAAWQRARSEVASPGLG